MMKMKKIMNKTKRIYHNKNVNNRERNFYNKIL